MPVDRVFSVCLRDLVSCAASGVLRSGLVGWAMCPFACVGCRSCMVWAGGGFLGFLGRPARKRRFCLILSRSILVRQVYQCELDRNGEAFRSERQYAFYEIISGGAGQDIVA